MSDLPDIDTSEVSWLGYWNAIEDGGAPSINPEDALDTAGLAEVDIYDNGWEATIDGDEMSVSGITNHKLRIKEDGWIVCYFPFRGDYDSGFDSSELAIQSSMSYYWDEGALPSEHGIIDNWQSSYTNLDSTIWDTISRVAGNLDVSTSRNREDMGLYNYNYPDATHRSLFTVRHEGFFDVDIVRGEDTIIDRAHLTATREDANQNPQLEINGATILNDGTITLLDMKDNNMIVEEGELWEISESNRTVGMSIDILWSASA